MDISVSRHLCSLLAQNPPYLYFFRPGQEGVTIGHLVRTPDGIVIVTFTESHY